MSYSFAVKRTSGLAIPARLALVVALAVGLSLSLAPAPSAHAATVCYVKPSATGSGDCSSWANACTLQTALGAAVSGDEIWVAEGTHTPGTDRTATFQLKSGVGVYGGFAGTETARSERDWVAHPTVLSGDLNDNGRDDNDAYHVVTGSGTDASAVLDGFTVSGGNADGTNPHNFGGGMYNYSGSPTLANVTFSDNSAEDGGGIYNEVGNPTLTNATFSGNSASYDGGGMYTRSGSPRLANVIFSGNGADDGGGMCNDNSSNPTLTNVTFSGNSAASSGGGMYSTNSSNPTLSNCILWGNTAPSGSQISDDASSAATVTYSDVQGGHPGTGNVNADPLFVDADGPDDIAGTLDDNLRLRATSPAVDAGDDTAVPAGITADLDGNPRIIGAAVDMGAYEALPAVVSITRAAADPTNAATVPFTVTFNVPVLGVDAAAFALTTTGGQGGAALGTIGGIDETWTVAVSTIASVAGTIRLDLQDTDTITATPGVPLGGEGVGNGDFAAGEVYTVDRAAPTVTHLDAPDVPEFGAGVYTITVVYSDSLALDVSSLDDGDLRVTGPGGFDRPATFASVTPSGDGTPRTATYHVTPPGGTWDDVDCGVYTVALVADQVRDTLGNAAAAGTLGTFNVGDWYVFLPLVIR